MQIILTTWRFAPFEYSILLIQSFNFSIKPPRSVYYHHFCLIHCYIKTVHLLSSVRVQYTRMYFHEILELEEIYSILYAR